MSASRPSSSRASFLAISLALALAGPAYAGAVHVEKVARGLERRPVYTEPGATRPLSEQEADSLAAQIEERNPERIQIAVFREDSARDSGGLLELSNAVDQALLRAGTLVTTAGDSYHVITTYPQSARAAAAVRVAVNEQPENDLEAQLEAAIDAVTEVDPGPAADYGGPPPEDDGVSSIDEVGDTARLVLIVVGAMIVLPFLIWGLVVLVRARRRRAEDQEELELERETLREELSGLSDDIMALDLDVSMPSADLGGKAAYEGALKLHERAGRQLARANSRRRVERAKATIAEARRFMDEAKRRLAASG
jgi:hypothetical protein